MFLFFLISMLADESESLCPGSCVHIDIKFICSFDISGREVSAVCQQKKIVLGFDAL